ncbi:phage head spike fiber domain-containing protein [Pseudomonas sp. NPDC077408]|uniref:phage head spike fiber domain-containing protein n=1 Tax=Streptomyces parvus TaxID=66428 RepID=UPI00371C1F61
MGAVAFSDLITFSRSSGGGRFNAQGVYEWLPANTRRIDYDPVTGECRGLLIEEQRTNLLTYSNAFGDAAWQKTSATISSGVAIGPDGHASMSAITETDTTGWHGIQQTVSSANGLAVVVSVYAKKGARDWLYMRSGSTNWGAVFFDLATGNVGGDYAGGSTPPSVVGKGMVHVGGGVYKCWAAFSSTDTLPVRLFASDHGGNIHGYTGNPGSKAIYIWGAQLEADSFPTSHIPTLAAQVTRTADIASVNTLSPWFNGVEGTLFVEAGMSSPNLPNWRRVLELAASGTSYIASFQTNNANGLSIYTNQDGVARTVKGTTTRASNNKMVVTWDSGSLSGSINSESIGALTLPQAVSPISLSIGGSIMSGYAWSGHIKAIRYFPKRLSGSELQALTA